MGLEDYDEKYLTCRDIRHNWAVEGYYQGTLGGIHRWLACQRCGTERYDHWMYGKTRRRYRYDDDYHIEGGVDLQDVRNEMFGRAKVYETLDSLIATKSRRRKR